MILLMKRLGLVTILLIFAGCSSSQNQPTPTQNESLNTISKSSAAKKGEKGWIQKNLDEWYEGDWKKNTKGFEEESEPKAAVSSATKEEEGVEVIQDTKNISTEEKNTQKQKTKSNPYTLQHIVDKTEYYFEHKEKTPGPSHVEEMEKMPVIGK